MKKREFAMMPVNDFVIFRSGDYGQKGVYTEKELDEMVSTFNTDRKPAVIIGHTSQYSVPTAIPKVGFIGGLKRVGNELIATASQFSDKLITWIKEGFYEDRSVELGRDENGLLRLERLGVLGANPPQIKGMPSLQKALAGCAFAEGDGQQVVALSFAEMDIKTVEETAKKDTLTNIQEAFAICLRDIEGHLGQGDEQEEIKTKCFDALAECYADVAEEIQEHFTFGDKLSSMAKKQETETEVETETETEDNGKENGMMAEFKKRVMEFFTHKRKETEMTDKEYAEKMSALDAERAKLEADKKEFADTLAQQTEAHKKAEDDAVNAQIEKQIAEFREECIAKHLPVNKMEEQGVFVLAKSLLKSNELEFGDGKKQPMEILRALTENVAPIMPEPVVFGDDPALLMTAAMTAGMKSNDKASRDGLVKVAFAEAYVRKHSAEIEGRDSKEKLSNTMKKLLLGEIPYDTNLL